MEIEKADNDQHAVYNQSLLDELLNNNDIDDFRKNFSQCIHMSKASILRITIMLLDIKYFNCYHLKKLLDFRSIRNR